MLNIVLCDDNPSFLNGLEEMLFKLFIKHNLDADISFKTDCSSKLLEHVKNNSVDVLFLDITLDNKNVGLSIAEEIRKINKSLHLIFTTAHFEFVMEAYKVNAFDYLVKPISQDKLEETLLRLIDYLDNFNNRFIKINSTTFINQDDVHYIRKDGMKLIFHTKDNEFETYNSFSKIKSILLYCFAPVPAGISLPKITFSLSPFKVSTLPLTAASVSILVVSWNDAALRNESVSKLAFVIPSKTALPLAGTFPSRI